MLQSEQLLAGRSNMPATRRRRPAKAKPRAGIGRILTVDIGGTKVKVLASGQTEPRKQRTGRRFTPSRMVQVVDELSKGWKYDAVSMGYPGLVGENGPRCEPGNLGSGWVGFDYAAALGCPVRFINDAAMQALGSYEGGRMLFLGLGTGLGSSLVSQNIVVPLELGELQYRSNETIGLLLGRRSLERIGKKEWRRLVNEIVPTLMRAFVVDYVVLGGGNAKELKELPPGARLGNNLAAFRGGFRLWHVDHVPTHSPGCDSQNSPLSEPDWKLI